VVRCRRLTAVLVAALSVLASGCGGGTVSAAQGTSVAKARRADVAKTFWRLYNSVGNSVIKTGGTGNFVPCTEPAAATIRYGIEVPFSGRTATQTDAEFARAMQQYFARVGYRLKGSGDNTLTTDAGNVSVRLTMLRRLKTGPFASLTVASGCFDAGKAASGILQHYGGASGDDYPQSRASASPVPTGFPTGM
jgi:hypothetical protein